MTLRHLKWRLLYAACTGAAAERVLSLLLSIAAALRGPTFANGLVSGLERRFGFSGWPMHGYGWFNLHVMRLLTRVRRRLRPRVPTPTRRAAPPRLRRVACVGQFAGLLGFPKLLLDACPVELVVADMPYQGQSAAYLGERAVAYGAFDVDAGAQAIDDAAAFLRRWEPDLVLNIGHKEHAHAILDRLDAPVIADYCAGSNLMHHPQVDVSYHGQPQADYFVADGAMFCGTTAQPFGADRVHTITGFIDPRDLPFTTRPWSAREPLIVCHGSLYKFASTALLRVVCRLLADDDQLQLCVCGKDTASALDRIQRAAKEHGVVARVHYVGHFSAVRDANGAVDSSGWRHLKDLLQRARLAPDPFPIGGGSSRFEAMACGTPVVHMGVRLDAEAWARPQPGNVEIPSLVVPRGTAWSESEYVTLCERILRDGDFADSIAAEQIEVARRVADPERWWREIVEGYEHHVRRS